MQNKDNKIDDVFKKGLQQLHEESPSELDWTDMKERMREEGIVFEKEKKKRRFIWFFILGTVVSFYAGSFYFLNLDKPNSQNIEDASNRITETQNRYTNKTTSEKLKQEDNQKTSHKLLDFKEVVAGDDEKLIREAKVNVFSSIKNDSKERSLNKPESISEDPSNDYLSRNLSKTLHSKSENNNIIAKKEITQNSQAVDSTKVVEVVDNISITDSIEILTVKADSSLILPNDSTPSNPPAIGNFNKSVIGLFASWDNNFYSIKTGNDTLMGPTFELNDSIQGLPSIAQYTFGVTIGYRVQKWLLLETGLFFSQRKKIHFDSGEYRVKPTANSTWANNRCYYNFNAKYLEAFFKTKIYYLNGEKFRLFISPGLIVETNMISSKENKDYYLFESERKNVVTTQKYTFDAGAIGLNLTASTGVEFKLKPNLLLGIEPSYNYGLTQIIRVKNFNMSPVKHFTQTFRFGIRLLKEF